MALQRQVEPLPPDVYWYAVRDGDHAILFTAFVSHPAVTVLKTETEGHRMLEPGHTWTLFRVAPEPTPGPNFPRGLGFPNIAEEGERTALGDTIEQPDPEPDLIDVLPTTKDVKRTITKGAWIIGLVLGGAWLLGSGKRR